VQTSGPTNNLFKVVAESEKGTEIKIPINYAESKRKLFIHFLSPKEKYKYKWNCRRYS
jgi:hypothetical protein